MALMQPPRLSLVRGFVAGRGPVNLRREDIVDRLFQGQEFPKNLLHSGEAKRALRATLEHQA